MRISVLFLLLLPLSFFAQTELTLENSVLGYVQTDNGYRSLYPERVRGLQWIPESNQYSFLEQNALQIVNGKKTSKVGLMEVGEATETKLTRWPQIHWKSANTFYFTHQKAVYEYNTETKKGKKTLSYDSEDNKDYHAGTNQMAFTKDNNLYLAFGDNINYTITSEKDANIVSGQAIARFEFGISKGTFWSPKGNYLAFYQKDESAVHDYPLLDMTKTPGELKSVKYPMAGQASEKASVGIYNVASKKIITLQTAASELGEEHYLTNLSWDPSEKFVYLTEVNRDQNHLKFTQYDVQTGELIKVLFEEKNKRYVEPEHPACFVPGKPNEFLWFSERDGFMNLFLYKTDGTLLRKVTPVKWEVQEILGFDAASKYVYIQGTGTDAREKHAFQVDLTKGTVQQLTQQGATHQVVFNEHCTKYFDTYSSLQIPGKTDLVTTKNGKSKNLLTAKNPLQGIKYGTTELITLQSEIDGTDLYGRIIKPTNFDPKKKYPVLVYVYGGPHAQLVTNTWMGGASQWMNWFAEQGYIVFTLDGHGSAHRGFEFESIIHRDLGTNEIKDQLTGVKYLQSLPYVDANRMAIHGWSFGGFMTTSLLLKAPDVFQAGVAGGPVIDWKWYEIMYGERYMDTPEQNKEGYQNASLLNKVKALKGDLLMIHGTVDDVVVMQHNLAFVKACVEAGVQLDFFPYPNHPHNVRGRDRVHLMTKVLNYITEKLED